MSKRTIRETPIGKTMGRSQGSPVIDPVLGDKVSAKIFKARKANNPRRYQNNDNN